MATQQEENSLKELEERQKFIPFAPCATSYGMGWKGIQALRYYTSPASGEYCVPSVSQHMLILEIRPLEKLHWRYEGVKRDRPLPAGSVSVVPTGSCQLVHWHGSMDTVAIFVEPSLVARVAAESFEFDPARTVVPPLFGLNAPELRSTMLAVNTELRAGGGGGQLLVEALATILSVHLIRHIMAPQRLPVLRDGVLSRRKLQTVIEYIMENLEGSPTLEQMAALAHLSPYHFARQFKATTGLPPYQYVIARRVERAQHLLRTHGHLGLAEVALRSGFSDQSRFSLYFKRITGVTPRQFRISAGIA